MIDEFSEDSETENEEPIEEDSSVDLSPEQSAERDSIQYSGYYDHKTLPKYLQDCLRSIKDDVNRECRPVRDRQIPFWKRNDAFWKGLQRGLYSELAGDYITSRELRDFEELGDVDFDDFERCINVMKAHGETIIAALSARLPSPKFLPKDADNPNDISEAKGSQKASELISLHNDATLKVIKGLFHLYVHGLTFSYKQYNRDKRFGIVKTPKIEFVDVNREINTCPICSSPIEEMPQNSLEPVICSTCNNVIPEPIVENVTEQVPKVHAWDETPCGRTLIEVYGPLHVTVPHYISDLNFAGFLRLDTDLDIALIKEIFPDLFEDESEQNSLEGNRDTHREDRMPVDQPFYEGQSISTVSRLWIRPWMFNRLGRDKKDEIVELKKLFPNGCYSVWINDDVFAEATDESLDDCWTATIDPTSEYIHADPRCNSIIPIQKMINDLCSLTLETIEESIPINFVDPSVVDLKELINHPANPGDFLGAKAKSGLSLDSSFASTTPAQLGRGIEQFTQYLDSMGQFVLGAFAPLTGGNVQGGSNTLGEYNKSIEQSMQRQGLTWKTISKWWCESLKKAVIIYKNNMIADEHFTKKLGNNSYTNVWIKKSEFVGEIGEVIVDNSEQLPVTWAQQRAMVMDMLAQKNPQFEAVLFHPENSYMMWELIGLTNMYIPGDISREKQLREIYDMMQSEPVPAPIDPMMMQMNEGQPPEVDPATGEPMPMMDPNMMQQMQSSVPVDLEVDDHIVHAEVIKAFLSSEQGQQLKIDNPPAFDNIHMHLQAHLQAMQEQAMKQAMQQGAGSDVSSNNQEEQPVVN
jgi:hypothetical protein